MRVEIINEPEASGASASDAVVEAPETTPRKSFYSLLTSHYSNLTSHVSNLTTSI